MNKVKTKYPIWFSPHLQPTFHFSAPSKTLKQYKTLKSILMYDGDYVDNLEVPVGARVKLRKESYQEECEVYLDIVEEYEVPNQNYDKESKRYDKLKKEHDEKHAEWKRLAKIFKQEEAERTRVKELKLLETLKQKYESE